MSAESRTVNNGAHLEIKYSRVMDVRKDKGIVEIETTCMCCQGQRRLLEICYKRLDKSTYAKHHYFLFTKDGSINEYEISELRRKEPTQTWHNWYSLPEEHIFHLLRNSAIESDYLVKWSRYLVVFIMSR